MYVSEANSEKREIMKRAEAAHLELRRNAVAAESIARRESARVAALTTEMQMMEEQRKHEHDGLRVELRAAGQELSVVRTEMGQALQSQAWSFEERVRAMASELRVVRSGEEAAQRQCTSQKEQVERWAADFSKKFYDERHLLIGELRSARQEIGNMRHHGRGGISARTG